MKKPHKLCGHCLNLGKKRIAIKACKYCNRNFCKDHINPEVVSYADKKLRAIIKGHRCLEFEEYRKLEQEEHNKKILKTLDEMKEAELKARKVLRPPERPEIPSPKAEPNTCHKCHKRLREDTNYCIYCREYFCDEHYRPKTHNCPSLKVYLTPPQVRRKIPIGKIIFLVLVIAGIWYFYNNPERWTELVNSLSNFFKSGSNYISNFTSETGISSSPKSITKPTIDIPTLEKQIHNLINEQRRSNGLTEIIWDDKLTVIARSHSQDMAIRNYFSHDSPDGCDPTCRYLKNNYLCHIELGGGYYVEGGAENLFQNNLYDSITYINGVPFYNWNSQDEIARTTVEGWMSSSGHRENILTSYWRTEGIGIAISSDDKVLITQNFC